MEVHPQTWTEFGYFHTPVNLKREYSCCFIRLRSKWFWKIWINCFIDDDDDDDDEEGDEDEEEYEDEDDEDGVDDEEVGLDYLQKEDIEVSY